MAIDLPENSGVVKDRIRADVQTQLPLSNPFTRSSWLGALVDSFAERVYDYYFSILQSIDEVFPDTTIDNLDRWASFYNISRNAATGSVGHVVFQGSGSPDPILVGQKFVDGNGNEYTATEEITASSLTINQTSLSHVGGVATFVCDAPHYLDNGDVVAITGAVNNGYNVTKSVTVVDEDTFTYLVAASIPSPTTGASFNRVAGQVAIKSDSFGEETNLGAFTELTLQSPVSGLDDDCAVNVNGLTGGSDRETDDQFRDRLLDIIRNPVAHFNVSDITRLAKTVSTITRVFVQEVTPSDGQVTVYVMSDNETNPIPSAAKVTEVKNALLTIKPANTSSTDVIVSAPTQTSQAFTFSSLSPNTVTMQSSITENLRQFFAENTEIGTNIDEDAYRSAIFSTIDTTTGESVTSFALSAPSGDITIAAGNIGVLGTVTYP